MNLGWKQKHTGVMFGPMNAQLGALRGVFIGQKNMWFRYNILW